MRFKNAQYKCSNKKQQNNNIYFWIMKAELIVIGCFLLLIGSSQAQPQPWAANTTPRRQISITQSQQRKGNSTQFQQQKPFIHKQATQPQFKGSQTMQPQSPKIQSKPILTRLTLNALQINKIKQSNNQVQYRPRTNQSQRKRTQSLGTSQKQTSINLTKPNTNRLQQRQSPTRQTANLSQQSRRTPNKMQTNLNQQQTLKPTSQFKTNQSHTSPIQQPRIQPKQLQRQRNLSLSQQKQAQTQRNRYPTKQMVNNVSQIQTLTNLSSQRKQKLPLQIQPNPVQNLQKASQTKNQSKMQQIKSQFQTGNQPRLNQILHENSTYPPEPHPYRMTPIYNSYLQRHLKFKLIKRLFNIGAAYFRKVLKVTPIPQHLTYYKDMPNQNKCQNIFDAKYRSQGFNQNITDIVIFVNITNREQYQDSSACSITLRPTYGVFIFLDQNLVQDYPLYTHSGMKITITQMLHILAFNQKNYQLFRMNYSSFQVRPYDQTVKCDDLNCYITTPKVKKYVRNYFNCNNSEIGAMLKSKTDIKYWNPRVFGDDIMSSGGRTTPLTLALLEDSGFFHSVDYTYSQNATFGKGKGCSFAEGIRSNQDQCKPNICHEDHRYGQMCKTLSEQTNLTYEYSALGFLCQDSMTQIEDPFTFGYYGQSSRCFNIQMDENRAPVCYKAECKNGVVYINIGDKTLACNKPGQWLEVDYYWKVQCPTNLQSFCAVPICDNYCEGKGMCVNGKCFYQ